MHNSYYAVMTQSSLQQPKCNYSAVVSHCSLCCCAPIAMVTHTSPGKAATKILLRPWLGVLRPLGCAISTRCAAAMCSSCTRCPPSILRMAERRGWFLCPLPALDTWQQLLWWLNGLLKEFVAGTFVKQQFPFVPSVSFRLLIIVKVPSCCFVLVVAYFLFVCFERTGCLCLIAAVQNHYSWLDEHKP